MSKPSMATPEATTAPPSTTVLFVRHGVTPTTGKVLPGRAAGLHLSDAGNAQAKTVAQHVALLQDPQQHRLEAIYASPLERTTETATHIADATGLEIRAEPDLMDLDIGDWAGMALEDALKRPEWASIQRYPSGFQFPGGESFLGMQTRMLAFVERARSSHPGETVVAVSHADPIRALVAHALGVHLDLFQRVVVSPCSITVVNYGNAGPTVLAVNAADVAHLVGT